MFRKQCKSYTCCDWLIIVHVIPCKHKVGVIIVSFVDLLLSAVQFNGESFFSWAVMPAFHIIAAIAEKSKVIVWKP